MSDRHGCTKKGDFPHEKGTIMMIINNGINKIRETVILFGKFIYYFLQMKNYKTFYFYHYIQYVKIIIKYA